MSLEFHSLKELQRFSVPHPKSDDFLLKTKTRKCNNRWDQTGSFNISDNTLQRATCNASSNVFMKTWCHKAGVISTIGVPCAPSVSPSQLLSYCYVQLGHVLSSPQNQACSSTAVACA